MAADVVRVWEGSMPATETALQVSAADYTPATGRLFILQGFWVYNSNAAAKYGNIKVGTTLLLGDGQIDTKKTLRDVGLNTPLLATEKLYVKGEVATDLKYRIWGLEVDVPA